MSKGDTYENDLLKLLFNGTPIPNIADNAVSSPLTFLYVSLHTADPGETGNQTTSEAAYTGYARVAVARTSAGFTVVGNTVNPTNPLDFPNCTAGTGTGTFFGIGTAPTGTGKLLYSGPCSPTIPYSSGTIPRLTTATSVTED